MITRIKRKKNEIILLDLFSGIGGFTKGLEDAGFDIIKHYYSEIDKHAIANYRYNYEKAELVGSVKDLGAGRIARPNIITFGSPCQDFSLAGKRKRKGMDGHRSSLIGEALRLIEEFQPDFFIWENVKGVFSSNSGADFWAIIKAFTDIRGYRLEWQLLNTTWVLPQNRERIYLIGHLAKTGRDFRGVFPIRKESIGINELGKHNETTNIRTLSGGGHSGGNHSAMTLVRHRSTEPYLEADCSPAIRNSDKAEVRIVTNTNQGYEVAKEGDSVNLTQPNSTSPRGRVGHGVAQTLDTASNQIVIVGNLKGDGGHNVHNIVSDQGIAPTVRSNHGSVQPEQVAQPIIVASRGRNPDNSSDRTTGSPTEQRLEVNSQGTTNTLTGIQKDNYVIIDDNYPNRTREYTENSPTIHRRAGDFKVSNIRRLTEIECERLQGFPDNWTEYGIYEKQVWINKKEKTFEIVFEKHKIPKSQRYKLLGNAVTAKIVELIGRRLLNIIQNQ